MAKASEFAQSGVDQTVDRRGDVGADATEVPGSNPGPATLWREVPQPRFDSWSIAMQLAYCAARDRASAAMADAEEERAWFLARAAGYVGDALIYKQYGQ